MKKAVFAGTFDPFTAGHADTVGKALKVFDEVVVAIAENPRKRCMFTPAEREEMIALVYREEPRVKTVVWSGAVVDLLKREKTPFYVRGLRNTVDFEYENADFFASRDLDGEMVTLYIPSEQANLHISSTLVKNCIALQKPYSAYVPKAVYDYIRKRGQHVRETD